MAKLIVNPTSPMRRELALPRSLLSIGRDPSNDLVLADAMVSRRHAVIELRANQYFLRDCSSSNGSLVNGDRVSERGLRDGDLVAIGTARLLFREDLAALDPAGKVVLHPSAPRLHCAQCGADYRRGDLFCKECGAGVHQAQPRTVCTACGSAVVQPARYCSACGAPLSPAEARAEGKPAEPGAGREVTALGPRPELSSGPHLVPTSGPPRAGAVMAASEGEPAAAHTAQAEQVLPMPADQVDPAVPAPAAHVVPPAPVSVAAVAETAEARLDIPSEELEGLPEWTVRAPAAIPSASGGGVAAGAERALPPPKSQPPRLRPSPDRGAALTKEQPWSPAARALREAPRASRGQAPQQTAAAAADLGARLLAGALDLLAVGLVQVLLLLPAGSYWWSRDLTGPTPLTPVALTAALLLLTLALGALYFIYLWGVWGATPGKRLVGLAVEGLDGSYPIGLPRATLRFLGYLLSMALLGGGFLLIVLDGSGLHDRLAATRVVRRRS